SVHQLQKMGSPIHFEILKWALQKRCKWDANTCALAAVNGHFEILKWARENGCKWNAETCANAALGKSQIHFEILKWCRSFPLNRDKCMWDFRVCTNAAIIGNFEILKWAIKNGCDLSSNIYSKIIGNA